MELPLFLSLNWLFCTEQPQRLGTWGVGGTTHRQLGRLKPLDNGTSHEWNSVGFCLRSTDWGGLRTEAALRITDGCCRWTCCITCVIVARRIFLLLLQPSFESDLCTYETHKSERKSYSTRLLYIDEQKQQKSIKYYEKPFLYCNRNWKESKIKMFWSLWPEHYTDLSLSLSFALSGPSSVLPWSTMVPGNLIVCQETARERQRDRKKRILHTNEINPGTIFV